MAATKVMLIRHGEKPSDDGKVAGVSKEGSQDPEELIVQGWQRSGALVRLFKPFGGKFSHENLATPTVIFAAGVGHHSKSLRPEHTVHALAGFLGLKLDLCYLKGDETALVKDALAREGTVLIAWQHEDIPAIANAILGNSITCPQKWPGDRFDLVWVLDRRPGNADWIFHQVPQLLLPGDQSTVIP